MNDTLPPKLVVDLARPHRLLDSRIPLGQLNPALYLDGVRHSSALSER